MPNFGYYTGRDGDECGCRGYGHLCEYHAKQEAEESERRREEYAADAKRRGVNPNPDLSLDNPVGELWVTISLSGALRPSQKDDIERILFPAGAPKITDEDYAWAEEKARQHDKAIDDVLRYGFGSYTEPPKPKKAKKAKATPEKPLGDLTFEQFMKHLKLRKL